MKNKKISTPNVFYLKSIKADFSEKKNNWALILSIRMLELNELNDIADWVMRNFKFNYTISRFYADDFNDDDSLEYRFYKVMREKLEKRYKNPPVPAYYNFGGPTQDVIKFHRDTLPRISRDEDIDNIVVLCFEPTKDEDEGIKKIISIIKASDKNT